MGQGVQKSEDTAKLRALQSESFNGSEDTDSLPILPDRSHKPPSRVRHAKKRPADAGFSDSLDLLISTTTALDERLDRIEKALGQIQNHIAELQKEKSLRMKLFAALTQRKSS